MYKLKNLLVICIFFLLFAQAELSNGQDAAANVLDDASNDPEVESSDGKDQPGAFDPTVPVDKPGKKPQTSWYVRPSAEKRFNRFVNSTVGPVSLGRIAARGALSTATNEPEEWGKDMAGFGRRFASNLGENAIRQTTIYALDEALKLDSKFYKSRKRDFGSKVKNALLSTVTARNKRGKRVFGVSRIAGVYGAAIVSREAWYPKRFGYKDGLKNGSYSLAFSTAFNLFKEIFSKK